MPEAVAPEPARARSREVRDISGSSGGGAYAAAGVAEGHPNSDGLAALCAHPTLSGLTVSLSGQRRACTSSEEGLLFTSGLGSRLIDRSGAG